MYVYIYMCIYIDCRDFWAVSIDLVGGKGLALLPDSITSGAGGQYCKEMHVSRCMSVVSVYLCASVCVLRLCACCVLWCVCVCICVVNHTMKSSTEMRVFCCMSVVSPCFCRRVCFGVCVCVCVLLYTVAGDVGGQHCEETHVSRCMHVYGGCVSVCVCPCACLCRRVLV